MAIYVDDPQGVVCHLVADSDVELLQIASVLSVSVQGCGHKSKQKCLALHAAQRAMAMGCGAIAVSGRQMAAMEVRRMVTGCLGCPGDAIGWFEGHRREMTEKLIAGEMSGVFNDR